MIEVSGIQVFGWKAAIRGMRNPMNSWYRSDSYDWESVFHDGKVSMGFEIGDNDLKLMKGLTAAGPEHRKFLRMVHVTMDICAPLYWWKEYDTYKVGTTANSCSTMHTIHRKEFALDDFSWDQLLNTDCDLFELEWGKDYKTMVQPQHFLIDYIIPALNICREKYLKTNDKKYWYQMIQLLPSSYNQLRTVDFSYETAINMIHQRKNHKLDEWRKFVDILKELPHMQDLMETFEEEGI